MFLNTAMIESPSQSGVIAEFAGIVGEGNAVYDQQALEAASTATFATAHSIPLIVRPSSREQVQRAVSPFPCIRSAAARTGGTARKFRLLTAAC
jgi:hypothetical protein